MQASVALKSELVNLQFHDRCTDNIAVRPMQLRKQTLCWLVKIISCEDTKAILTSEPA